MAKKRGNWIWLDFPSEPKNPVSASPGLAKPLGIEPIYVGKNRFDYLIQVESEAVVLSIQPNFGLLATIPSQGTIVTSMAQKPLGMICVPVL